MTFLCFTTSLIKVQKSEIVVGKAVKLRRKFARPPILKLEINSRLPAFCACAVVSITHLEH